MICIQSASTTPGLLQHSLPQHVISLNTWRPPHPPNVAKYFLLSQFHPCGANPWRVCLAKRRLSDGINLQPTPPPPSLTAQHSTAQALSQHRHLGTLTAQHRPSHNHHQQAALQPNLPECAATNFTEAKAEAQTCVKEEHSNKYTCTDFIKFTINSTSTSAITIHTQHSPAAPADDQKSTLSSNELAKMHLKSPCINSCINSCISFCIKLHRPYSARGRL